MSVCSNCGFDSVADAVFCGNCGTRIGQVCEHCERVNPMGYQFLCVLRAGAGCDGDGGGCDERGERGEGDDGGIGGTDERGVGGGGDT